MGSLNFGSLPFWGFVLSVICIYWILPRNFRNHWLLIASLFFYVSWGIWYLVALCSVILLNYCAGQLFTRTRNKTWLWIGLAGDLALFGVLKFLASAYGYTFIKIIYPYPLEAEFTALLLPVGFSFYILQALSYLIDLSRQQPERETSFVEFALYLAYFPKLLAGPIERPMTFFSRLQQSYHFDLENMGKAIGYILVGLLRKIVIANTLSLLRPMNLFSNTASFSLLEKFVWLVVFGIVLYNDFAGYSNIARGLSMMFGIELTQNFRQPFFASSISDFWNRWHISLSNWFRDYIFFPLQRFFRRNSINQTLIIFLAPLFTMLISGLWHGLSLSMLFWGGLHGVFLAAEQLLFRNNKKRSPLINVFTTFLLVTLAWVPFSATKLQTALLYFPQAFSFPPFSFDWILMPDILLLGSFSFLLDYLEEKAGTSLYFMNWPFIRRTWAIAIVLLLLVLFSRTTTDMSGFVYQGF